MGTINQALVVSFAYVGFSRTTYLVHVVALIASGFREDVPVLCRLVGTCISFGRCIKFGAERKQNTVFVSHKHVNV